MLNAIEHWAQYCKSHSRHSIIHILEPQGMDSSSRETATSSTSVGAVQSLEHACHHGGDGWAASWVDGDTLPCEVSQDQN